MLKAVKRGRMEGWEEEYWFSSIRQSSMGWWKRHQPPDIYREGQR